jgi:hypothetical protein
MKQIVVLSALFVIVSVALPALTAETDPVPANQLTPGVALVAPDATETYGSVGTTWSGVPRERGNIFSVASAVNVTLIEWYLTVPSSETIYFVIYRKLNDGTLTGTYDQDFITSVVTSTSGPDWVSSGAMSYTLDPSYYYYMSVAWDTVSCTYYRGTEATPFATGFGQLETGVAAGSGHPATWNNTYSSGSFSPYYQRLTFDPVPVELQSLIVE